MGAMWLKCNPKINRAATLADIMSGPYVMGWSEWSGPKGNSTMQKSVRLPENGKAWDAMLVAMKEAGLIPAYANRILLYGGPRTGKSTFAAKLFDAERATIYAGMTVDSLVGGFAPKEGTGGFQWADSVATRAMRKGGFWVADEIDQIIKAPECRFTMHSLMDDMADCAVMLSSGERVVAQPGYGVIATTNFQPNVLPDPILDRFDLILPCNTLAAGLRQRLGPLADAAERSVKAVAQWTRPCSPNLLLSATKLAQAGIGNEQIAAMLYPDQPREQVDLVTLMQVAGD
jgi:hypothetical protein